MIIRIESSVTLQVEDRHYLKESRTLEMEHDDIITLLCTDPELQGRYESASTDEVIGYEAVQDAFDTGFAALREGLWSALDDQMKELMGENDEE